MSAQKMASHGSSNNGTDRMDQSTVHTNTGNNYINPVVQDHAHAHFGNQYEIHIHGVVVGNPDQSAPGRKECVHHLPELTSTTFVGRLGELKSMREHLSADNSALLRRSVICGIGGAGKSRLAYAYYDKYASEFSSAFLVNGTDKTSMRNDFIAISRHLKLPEAPTLDATGSEESQSGVAAVEAVIEWFKQKDNDDWLLIIDNLEMGADDLRVFLPPKKNGHIIFTTQKRQAASLGPTIDLGEMSEQDALELFLHHADMKNANDNELRICKEIISRLGRLALAVEHAAAFVRLHKMPQRYLEQLEQELDAILEQSPEHTDHSLSVMATYKVTFQAIFKKHSQAAYLLTYVGALDGESLPEYILRSPSVAPNIKSWCIFESRDLNFIDDYSTAIETLLNYSLVRLKYLEDGTTAISMHTLTHKCVQAKRNQESQWLYLLRAAIIIFLVTAEAPCNPSTFAQIRYLFKTVTGRANQPGTGKVPDDLWLVLGNLLFTHWLSWMSAGIMQELSRHSKIAMEALGKSGRDQDRVTLAALSSIYASSLAFGNSDETPEGACRAFLYSQMLPSVANVLRHTHRTIAKFDEIVSPDLQPTQLVEVYTHTHPPDYVTNLRAIMKGVALFYFGLNQPEMGSLYHQMSQLPVKNTIALQLRWYLSAVSGIAYVTEPTADDELCQLHKVAAYDRHAGSINSTVELFRHITSRDRIEPEDTIFDVTLCDYIKLLCKLGRTTEAAVAAQKFMYPSPKITEADIATRNRSQYLWIRKAFMVANVDHETHEEVGKRLLETHAVSKLIFGGKSLNAAHAALLLHIFYSQSCCNHSALAKLYHAEAKNTLAHLYGGKAKLQNLEGLHMAKILLSEGALEEAVYCLEILTQLAENELAPEDPITVNFRRLTSVARAEREEELEDVREGRVGLKWGCFTLKRDVSGL